MSLIDVLKTTESSAISMNLNKTIEIQRKHSFLSLSECNKWTFHFDLNFKQHLLKVLSIEGSTLSKKWSQLDPTTDYAVKINWH